jgi:hypothetical protein
VLVTDTSDEATKDYEITSENVFVPKKYISVLLQISPHLVSSFRAPLVSARIAIGSSPVPLLHHSHHLALSKRSLYQFIIHPVSFFPLAVVVQSACRRPPSTEDRSLELLDLAGEDVADPWSDLDLRPGAPWLSPTATLIASSYANTRLALSSSTAVITIGFTTPMRNRRECDSSFARPEM